MPVLESRWLCHLVTMDPVTENVTLEMHNAQNSLKLNTIMYRSVGFCWVCTARTKCNSASTSRYICLAIGGNL